AAGAGAPGVAIPAEPALEPIPTGPGAPSVSPGISSLIVDGSPEPFVATTAGGTWTVSTSAFTVELEGTNADGGTLALDDQGRLLTMQSGSMMVRGTGFRPGSMVDVWLLAGSHLLGEVPVAGDGTFARSFRIPSGVATGANTVQVNGVSGSGALRTLSIGVVVLAAPATPELASTGADPSGALSLAVACLVLGLPLVAFRPSTRRRRGLHRAG
ncbi:MAG TPA: hypothetical protein VFT01_07085, partial [Homoserinimonas sp.]|nr:hypothetical protein [Homoserinimonas sp.]